MPNLSYDVTSPDQDSRAATSNSGGDSNVPRFAVAPMMDWTDRHCRYFHRLLTKQALLYTEMVVADALIHGDVARHLRFEPVEHPIAVQLGGSEPDKLIHAAKLCAEWGYDEINLNVGCPSDRVQSGAFGACLMREPDLVADCVAAMKEVVAIPVTVKCRIGVDDQDPETALRTMASSVFDAGCDGLWVHARKAWLQGLSPKQNRDVPPLDYDLVAALKAENPNRFIGINGGIASVDDALVVRKTRANRPLDGVMLGRAAYQNPSLLAEVDAAFYGMKEQPIDYGAICQGMMEHCARHLEQGGRVHHVTRHMIGLFQGQAGVRRYRQVLSVDAAKPDADEQLIRLAFDAVLGARDAA